MTTKQTLIYTAVFAVGSAAGFGAGYLVFKKKYQALADAEIESVRQSYAKSAMPKPDLKDLPQAAFSEPDLTEQIIAEEEYGLQSDADAFRKTHGRVPTTKELIQMGTGIEDGDTLRNAVDHDDDGLWEGNIFDMPQPDPEEIGEGIDEPSARPKDRPYVISSDEWYANETDYDQVTLTYWADDDVLADVTDRLITDTEGVVGDTNLHRFGFKSNDPDTVYVRNDRLQADYEITKDERSYAEIVHKLDPDEYNKSGVPRRMRSNDE